ncbi:MAG TPA: NADH-quinone oxidoreductase subunit L [Candidatus Acidoferrum sp.]|nr:NADH-quinone oxidoreductase subunit L [Candidatus Acidoferrum sp.]
MEAKFFLDHIWLIPLFPLATAAAMLLIGRGLKNSAVSVLCVGSVFVSFLFSVGAFFQLLSLPEDSRVAAVHLFDWFPPIPYHSLTGGLAHFRADWGFQLDPLSAVMILVVTGVGFLIHVYSIGYMGHEGGYYRFFGYLNLFMFSMLMLVLGNNLLVMFVGWEGVGTCSYLLIGFYFHKKSASDAGKKAFIVNRIGDAGFLLGIFMTSALLGTIHFAEIGPALLAGNFQLGDPRVTAIALLLFVGATGKSAQIPLYVWLPDAMEGPTPVSALIHAATMVTAGVYMVTRTNAIYQLAPTAMEVVAVIGAVTAIFAATMGVVQNDIKKVLAYSTISQLGYMFLACGVGAFAAGIFHLMTHAFFKGLLFLAAGSVIHALSGEQDMQKMGALSAKIRTTYLTMLAATLAIAGIPPFAGFFSKDEILGHAFEHSRALWLIGWITAGLTAFYMFRLLFLTFHGESRVDHEVEHHVHESPKSMLIPLVILALLSIVGGWIGIGGRFEHFLRPSVGPLLGSARSLSSAEMSHAQPLMGHEGPLGSQAGREELAHEMEETTPLAPGEESALMVASVLAAFAGIGLAWFLYIRRTELPRRIAARFSTLYDFVFHKYYVDELYDAMFVNRAKDLGLALGSFDRNVIDGLGVNGAGWLTRFVSRLSIWWDTWIVDGSVRLGARIVWFMSFPVRMIQDGEVQDYMLLIVLGLIGVIAYYFHLVRSAMH